jgi:hypothetical protein
MGDGEDIGSDLDGDEEDEEEEEDSGFVVPDGYGSDDCEAEPSNKNKKRKLEQVCPNSSPLVLHSPSPPNMCYAVFQVCCILG